MPNCEQCGGHLVRKRRTPLSRIFSKASYSCENCGEGWQFYRSLVSVLQPGCRCPRCHNPYVSKLGKVDKIDTMSPNPLRRLLGLFGFPLYHCTFCRFQFRDWRKREKRPGRETASGTQGIGQNQ